MSLDDRTGDKFKSGYYYSLVINFAANGDYVISDDITATVNDGKENSNLTKLKQATLVKGEREDI